MDVSVIIPVYNRPEMLLHALDSVYLQNYSSIETIVIDDCSEMDIKSKIKNHPLRPVFVRHSSNKGAGAARNTGIKLARGNFITFLDSDDYYLEGKVKKQVDHITNSDYPENTVSFCQSLVCEDNGIRIVPEAPMQSRLIFDAIVSPDTFIQTNTLVLSSKLAKNTLFDEELRDFDDWDFCLRLAAKGAEFIFLPEPLTVFMNNNRKDRVSSHTDFRIVESFCKKHKERLSEKNLLRLFAERAARPGMRLSLWRKLFHLGIAAVRKAVSFRYFFITAFRLVFGCRITAYIGKSYTWITRKNM